VECAGAIKGFNEISREFANEVHLTRPSLHRRQHRLKDAKVLLAELSK
jgi:hypothetical protein